MTKSKKKKTVIILVISILLILLSLLTVMSLMFKRGIWRISFSRISQNGFSVVLPYADCSGYSVSAADAESLVYRGERCEALGDRLGTSCFQVDLFEADVRDGFREDYAPGEVHEIQGEGYTIRFIWFPHAERQTVVFIGSDRELQVEEVHVKYSGTFRRELGRITIPVAVEESLAD